MAFNYTFVMSLPAGSVRSFVAFRREKPNPTEFRSSHSFYHLLEEWTLLLYSTVGEKTWKTETQILVVGIFVWLPMLAPSPVRTGQQWR